MSSPSFLPQVFIFTKGYKGHQEVTVYSDIKTAEREKQLILKKEGLRLVAYHRLSKETGRIDPGKSVSEDMLKEVEQACLNDFNGDDVALRRYYMNTIIQWANWLTEFKCDIQTYMVYPYTSMTSNISLQES
jgi:hypothetical protein